MSYSNSFCLATAQMISSHSVASGPGNVKLNWTPPKFEPERYQLNYVCTMKPTCTPRNDTNHYIMTKTQNVSSDTTSVTISDLPPSSICMLILLAVYNPASIDTGIVISGTTLDEDTRNIVSGLHYLIITVLFVYASHCIYSEQQPAFFKKLVCRHPLFEGVFKFSRINVKHSFHSGAVCIKRNCVPSTLTHQMKMYFVNDNDKFLHPWYDLSAKNIRENI